VPQEQQGLQEALVWLELLVSLPWVQFQRVPTIRLQYRHDGLAMTRAL